MGAVISSTRSPTPPTLSPVPANASDQISPPAGTASPQTTAEGEEEEECGFCLFMKGGPCKDEFIAWKDCAEERKGGEEVELATKCSEVTLVMKRCLEANPDYYGPILKAEKKAEELAAKEEEKEKNYEIATSFSP